MFDGEFQSILAAMGEAKTVEAYTEAAGALQDWYAAHVPLIALYWDSQILVHSAAYENFTEDAVFGLNNVNTWFTITATCSLQFKAPAPESSRVWALRAYFLFRACALQGNLL